MKNIIEIHRIPKDFFFYRAYNYYYCSIRINMTICCPLVGRWLCTHVWSLYALRWNNSIYNIMRILQLKRAIRVCYKKLHRLSNRLPFLVSSKIHQTSVVIFSTELSNNSNSRAEKKKLRVFAHQIGLPCLQPRSSKQKHLTYRHCEKQTTITTIGTRQLILEINL